MTEALALRLRCRPGALWEARRAVDTVHGLSPSTRDALKLVASELVANSVRHGRLRDDDHIDLAINALPDHVRVDVRDPGVGFVRPSADKHGGGHGLAIVQRLARHFGISRNNDTHAWAEINHS